MNTTKKSCFQVLASRVRSLILKFAFLNNLAHRIALAKQSYKSIHFVCVSQSDGGEDGKILCKRVGWGEPKKNFSRVKNKFELEQQRSVNCCCYAKSNGGEKVLSACWMAFEMAGPRGLTTAEKCDWSGWEIYWKIWWQIVTRTSVEELWLLNDSTWHHHTSTLLDYFQFRRKLFKIPENCIEWDFSILQSTCSNAHSIAAPWSLLPRSFQTFSILHFLYIHDSTSPSIFLFFFLQSWVRVKSIRHSSILHTPRFWTLVRSSENNSTTAFPSQLGHIVVIHNTT